MTPAWSVGQSIWDDFPVFAERTDERGSTGTINEIVCDSTVVLLAIRPVRRTDRATGGPDRQRTPFAR